MGGDRPHFVHAPTAEDGPHFVRAPRLKTDFILSVPHPPPISLMVSVDVKPHVYYYFPCPMAEDGPHFVRAPRLKTDLILSVP